MKFISAEEFSKQPKEVQKVFKEWWKVELGDLYCESCPTDLFSDERINTIKFVAYSYGKYEKSLLLTNRIFVCPLFTECQLREFIEDKTEFPIDTIKYEDKGYWMYTRYKAIDNYSDMWLHEKLGDNLLQAYWKVACIIAGEVSNE